MTSYILRRLVMTIPILIGISILSFAIMYLAPGDPASMLIDPNIKPEDLERMSERLGLNDPPHVQYMKWVGHILQGDLGTSFIQRRPVNDIIMERLPNTLVLMIASSLFAIVLAIPFGVLSATRQYSVLDYSVTTFSFIGVATPNFWLGLMLLMIFSVQLGWFPSGGIHTINVPFSIWDRIHHLILPMIVLGSYDMASLMRYTRSSMLDVIRQDYIRTARAKGFRERTVIYKHGLRNAMIPVITIFGLMLPTFIGGSVVVETLFSWPGIGQLFINSVVQRDYPVIMALTMFSAVLVVIGNLLADIFYAIVDPRIEY
ncbi:peptide/nickel transport system permease protein [Caldalkalibacillus uzonensis]|uniref:Peptide/nickel transport system permease protein n=1 Tax=Caldalkalibacillus uzonensis TaxID=353224 RepID=A0ABU0CXJ7_9BACI|nr:ABC transporter permease [Caldalkalibacillus uzonensis]MDQ0340605.1 peptide/nickel transport system permease protein [Caldalkalibacillus uzonensis]